MEKIFRLFQLELLYGIKWPVNDLIVSTNERVEEFYQFMWSQVPVMLAMYFLQGADLMRFARIAGINQGVMGEYIYHFSWG